jgi:ubiquinone/menaquinone biosynthesis C-methylase UbiE
MPSWQEIWTNRIVDLKNGNVLEQLIAADGFDHGPVRYSAEHWLVMVGDALERAGVGQGSALLEIGCGAGAFLLAAAMLKRCRVFGIDYSKTLIDIAREKISEGQFVVAEANQVPFRDVEFDSVFSHGVFHYFPDHAYAETVVRNSFDLLKPGGTLCIMDLNDQATFNDYHRTRRQHYEDPEEYDRAYKDLPHLFFDKDKFLAMCKRVGFRKAELFAHAVKDYGNAGLRFNVLVTK